MNEDPPRTASHAHESIATQRAVYAVLADPTRIPEWAPAFADRVARDPGFARDPGSEYTATKDGRSFGLRVVTGRSTGTVDYLREIAPGREGGAYLRVIPRPGDGSVITMTVPVPPGVDPSETADLLTRELTVLAALAMDIGGS